MWVNCQCTGIVNDECKLPLQSYVETTRRELKKAKEAEKIVRTSFLPFDISSS